MLPPDSPMGAITRHQGFATSTHHASMEGCTGVGADDLPLGDAQNFGAALGGARKKKAKAGGAKGAAPLATAGGRIDRFLARPTAAAAAQPEAAQQVRPPPACMMAWTAAHMCRSTGGGQGGEVCCRTLGCVAAHVAPFRPCQRPSAEWQAGRNVAQQAARPGAASERQAPAAAPKHTSAAQEPRAAGAAPVARKAATQPPAAERATAAAKVVAAQPGAAVRTTQQQLATGPAAEGPRGSGTGLASAKVRLLAAPMAAARRLLRELNADMPCSQPPLKQKSAGTALR